jgi:hypothetical protein
VNQDQKGDISMTDNLRAMVNQLGAARIPGGCDHCDAYQTMDKDPDHPRIFHLRIHHDDWCPFLARVEKGRPST